MADVWVTKNGRHIPIEEMDEGHMVNAWRWVDRMLDQIDKCLSSVYAVAPVDMLDWDWSDEHLYQNLVNLKDRKAMLRKEFKRRGVPLPREGEGP